MTGYRDIAAELRAAIERGDHPVESTLPKQDDLAATYGVNVKTIRAAVAVLVAEGMVTPVRRLGTVVTATSPQRYADPAEGISDPGERLAARIATALALYEREQAASLTQRQR